MSAQTEPGAAQQDALGLARLIFFSAAVFAIAITLLALDIRLPQLATNASERALLTGLLDISPQYFGYWASFVVIGLFWVGRQRMFRYIARYEPLLIAFVPFPARLIGGYGGNRVALGGARAGDRANGAWYG